MTKRRLRRAAGRLDRNRAGLIAGYVCLHRRASPYRLHTK